MVDSFNKQKAFGRVVISGMGVMGASLGYALKQGKQVQQVVGLVRRDSVIPDLLSMQLADVATTSAMEACKGADLIVIATPVSKINEQVSLMLPFMESGVVVTDMGSVKQCIVAPCQELLSGKGAFVGSHPMTGTEKFGFANFVEGLYSGMPCIVTRDGKTDAEALDRIQAFWQSLGSRISLMSPEEHDDCVGFISHLPHVVSFTLMKCLMEQKRENPFLFDLAGGSFRDMTRIAASSADIWMDILLANKDRTLGAIRHFQNNLDWFEKALKKEDLASLRRHLNDASQARQEFDARP